MIHFNHHPDRGRALDPIDAEMLGEAGADNVERYLATRDDHAPTPLHSLPGLARAVDLGNVFVKDEGSRLGLGSFKALGGSYAVVKLVLEETARRLGKPVDFKDRDDADVRAIASGMTFACATDGNHGRSVAQGARLVGAGAVIFVHAGVSRERVSAISSLGARIVTVDGSYDDSVAEASRVAAREGWSVVSDTSKPGYERIPLVVMQGYTAMVREALCALPLSPTHVFVQAGVGGVAAAVAAHLSLSAGIARPTFVVVEPARAACLFATARAGRLTRIEAHEPTIMAMLECHEPSLVAWRILSRLADAFMTVDEEDAVAAMRRLARPEEGDPAIVSGESGCVGLAGMLRAAARPEYRSALSLDAASRVLLINTEGATDRERYRLLTGAVPANEGPYA